MTASPHNGKSLILAVLCAVLAFGAADACGAGGMVFEQAPESKELPDSSQGAVWDLSKPLWVFFAQQRLFSGEAPIGEWVPRTALVNYRPLSENSRLFLIVAWVAYLVNHHYERDGLELEASLFTMLMPVGSTLYEEGEEVPEEDFESAWADVSLRFLRTWPSGAGPLRVRVGGEYTAAARFYQEAEKTADGFVLPEDGLTHLLDLKAGLDTRGRGASGDFERGVEFELGASYEVRDRWTAWGVGGSQYDDPDAREGLTAYASLESHRKLDSEGLFVLHAKARAAAGWNLDRLTYIRIGGGGFGRQFDRVGAGSTGASNDGELFRSDGVPGHFGGEFLTDRYWQLNLELDLPAGTSSRCHVYAAGAQFRDAQDEDRKTGNLFGFGLGFTRIWKWTRGYRLDFGWAPPIEGTKREGKAGGTADLAFTYLHKF